MNAHIRILVYVTLNILLFAACGTKREVSYYSIAILKEPAEPDAKSWVRPYYYPKLNQQLPQAKITLPTMTTKDIYEVAYKDLMDMLEGRTEADFEMAVFISENPYHNGRYDYIAFQKSIDVQLKQVKEMIAANDKSKEMDFNAYVNSNGRFKLADIRYMPDEKKSMYLKNLSNWAIFKYLTDTVYTCSIRDSALVTSYHAPHAYATSDPFGKKDWSHSQVMNLLMSEKNEGNCFALTALYKILADRLNTGAKICTAPQHIYIQHQDAKGQYYNVELATAGHPGDGIIQTLTYTPSEAIMSGIALRDYTTKQSIGLCLINLAKGYEHKFETKDDEFILRCAELALKYDSLNLNALLLKQQVLDERIMKYAKYHRINTIQKLKQDTAIAETVLVLEQHLALLYQLGYRQMPLDMQKMILNQLRSEPNNWNHQSRNARPFTSFEPKDAKDAEYWTITAGMFKEVWEPTVTETYGHFTITTASGKLKAIDTVISKEPLIDPVAFAYDFGARMYDARIGRWTATDPRFREYTSVSPYAFALNNPIYFKDANGEVVVDSKGNEVTVTVTKNEDGTYSAAYQFAEGTDQATKDLFMANGGRIINALIQAPTGRDQLQKAIESKDNIHMTVSPDKSPNGELGHTLLKPGDAVGGYDEKTKDYILNLEVIVYEGSINEVSALKPADENKSSQLYIDQQKEFRENDLNQEQKVGRTGAHELEHATNPIDRDSIKNLKDVSFRQHQVARAKATAISNEYGEINRKASTQK